MYIKVYIKKNGIEVFGLDIEILQKGVLYGIYKTVVLCWTYDIRVLKRVYKGYQAVRNIVFHVYIPVVPTWTTDYNTFPTVILYWYEKDFEGIRNNGTASKVHDIPNNEEVNPDYLLGVNI